MSDSQNYYPSPVHNGSPAGVHGEGVRLKGKRNTGAEREGLFSWIRKRLPSPGAGNFAFSTLSLFELSPIGPAVAARKLYMTVQPQQLYLNGQVVGTVGYGGLIAGQYISQPLLDPATMTYGGIPIG